MGCREWLAEQRLHTISNFLRDPEIRDLDASLVVNQDVGSLDVSVNDIPLVQVFESYQNLPDKVLDERFFECAIVVE